MNVTQYSTSVDEIFNYLYQDLFYNSDKQATTHEERADVVKEKWVIELEQIFKRKGLRFSYSLKPSERTCHSDDRGGVYFTINAPIYTFTLER